MSTVSLARPRVRRCSIAVEGLVQGVGYRPFVYRAAARHGLTGTVRNSLQGALVEVEGDEERVRRFVTELQTAPPAGVRYHRFSLRWDEPRDGGSVFAITESVREGPTGLVPAPDLPACEACLAELADAHDRRRGHALITCTACGPRFTTLRGLPYDRERTTLAGFPACARCRAEYADAGDRRFHQEAIACPQCGPRLSLLGRTGTPLDDEAPVATAAGRLRQGWIVAVKGVGGYHLACDATRGEAVAELRRRKRREAKPLAVMVADLEAARVLGHVSDAEARLLTSAARPIVLVARRAGSAIADEVAPGCRDLGIMLPYTPVHHLLLRAAAVPLVMTSGNASDEAIVYRDADAPRLHGVADLFLAHDRPIATPCDDSVARVVRGVPRLVRRSRGHVPLAVRLPVAAPRPVLACGAELKSAFALVRDDQAFVGQHLGDLTTESAFHAFLDAVAHFQRLFDLSPEIVAHDLHPAYRSTIFARSLEGVERVGVQHHHAHVASCLADNGLDRRVIGVAWDGTGHGADGTVWGGEFLVADLAGFERAGHFEPVPLPGGDAAVREPWRMAAVFLRAAYGEAMGTLDLAFVRRLDRAAWRVLARAADQGLNAPLTSSAGRLFDAVASLLGVRDRVGFEAQAAMELEALAEPEADRVYAVRVDEAGGTLVVRTPDVVRGVVEDLLSAVPPPRIAARFHATLADVLARTCDRLRARTGLAAVALSGGVFQNAWLLSAAIERLEAGGFEVHTHHQVPASDGGLALGQAAVAARRLASAERG
jgi:hydrogenase maturation protein HypF